MSHPRVLHRERSLLVVIDVQEGYRDKTFEHARMVGGVCRLIDAARILSVPMLVTEQYPKGLGATQHELQSLFVDGQEVTPKLSMSCWQERAFAARLEGEGRRQVVVCGIEAHACVNQTVHDLLDQRYEVHVVYDAISARSEADYRIGWEKMIGSGAVPATVEMVCLEWVRTAEAPEFKAIHRLIK